LGKIAKPGKGILYALLGFASIVIVLGLLHAQTFLNGGQSRPPDSFVQVAADSQGLSQVAPADLPSGATYWWVMANGSAVPAPCLPKDLNAPIYQITDAQFLVDATGGQVAVNSRRFGLQRQTTANNVATIVAAQTDSVVNLINQIQAREYNRQVRAMAMAMGIPSFGGGDSGGYSGNGYTNNYVPYTFDTNGLWLGNPTVSNGVSYVNLNNATNQVYAILTTTNLLGSWQVETIVWPTNNSVMPFTAQNADRPILFFRGKDWTGVTENGNTTPDWWLWQYFGTTAVADTNLDYSNNGNTFAQDYASSNAPTVFSYTGVEVANNNVNASVVPVQLDVAGSPYYIATLVDDTNFNNAVWNAYSSANVTVNLGSTEGWHDVWIGLRGHADATNAAVWQWQRLKLTFTPPSLFITGPATNPVTMPLIQLTGYSGKALSSLAYDISNAAGTASNQQAVVTGQFYDTNTMEFTTNYFQGYDVQLTNGVNTITIHATDLAGNMATLTTNIYCTGNTNPPAVNLTWPQNGMQVSGDSFTIQGSSDDPTATVTVTAIDADGNTTTINGLTGRDGIFWIENVPLNPGTNYFTVTMSNPTGDTTTNFNLIQSDGNFSVNTVQAGDTTVTGTVTNGYTVWVNGVQATNTDGNTWTATITPIGIGGGLVRAVAIPNTDNGGQGSGGGSGVNPHSAQSLNTQSTVQPPQGVFVSAYHNHDQTVYNLWSGWNQTWFKEKWYYNMDWQDGQGGKSDNYSFDNYYYYYYWFDWYSALDEIEWAPTQWPQALPNGDETITDYNNNPHYTHPPSTTSTNGTGSPGLPQEHYDFTRTVDANGSVERKTSDTEMKLVTGGPLGSTHENLWMISASATDADTGLPIPPEQIKIGSFGNLDTNGNLYVVLPDGDPDVTPDPGRKNYTFTEGATEFHPYIQVNGVALDYDTPTICVGQRVTFAVGWFPYTPDNITDVSVGWSLPGTFVNTNSDPNCDLYYSKDSSKLIRSKSQDGTTSTSGWYVKGITNGTVKLVMTLTLTNGQQIPLKTFGHFNVYRPTVIGLNHFPDGQPTPQISANQNFLVLGDNHQHNDMSFKHQIRSDTFSGDAGYVQLVGFDGADFQDQVQTHVPLYVHIPPDINLHPINNLDTIPGLGEMPRGTTTIPAFDANNANSSWTQPFSDGPLVYLADNSTTTIQHLHFHNYLMFRPQVSGYGPSIFVPLWQINWYVKASGLKGNNQPDQSSADITLDSDCTTFPEWSSPVNLNANQPPEE